MNANPDPDRSERSINGEKRNDGEVVEPENSTVDDWFGQRVDRDTELAEELAEESDSEAEASRRFDEQREGSRPEDLPTEERP